MINKTSLTVYNEQAQELQPSQQVSFPTVGVRTGCANSLVQGASGETVTINKPGLYQVIVNADILGTSAGNVQLVLERATSANPQAQAVPGAEATVTTATGDTYSVSFATLVNVLPSCPSVNNRTTLSVQLNTTAATINSANMNIVRIA